MKRQNLQLVGQLQVGRAHAAEVDCAAVQPIGRMQQVGQMQVGQMHVGHVLISQRGSPMQQLSTCST